MSYNDDIEEIDDDNEDFEEELEEDEEEDTIQELDVDRDLRRRWPIEEEPD